MLKNGNDQMVKLFERGAADQLVTQATLALNLARDLNSHAVSTETVKARLREIMAPIEEVTKIIDAIDNM